MAFNLGAFFSSGVEAIGEGFKAKDASVKSEAKASAEAFAEAQESYENEVTGNRNILKKNAKSLQSLGINDVGKIRTIISAYGAEDTISQLQKDFTNYQAGTILKKNSGQFKTLKDYVNGKISGTGNTFVSDEAAEQAQDEAAIAGDELDIQQAEKKAKAIGVSLEDYLENQARAMSNRPAFSAKAKAAREAEDPDAKIEFYTIEQREKKVERTRMLAQSELKLKIGSLGEGVLQGKLKGTNALPFAELLTAQKLFIDNNAGYKEEQMYKSINGIVDNAKRSFNQYVESNSNKILGANTFSSKEDLRNAIKTGGRLKVGDMYAFLQPASTKTVDGVEVSTPEAYVAGTYLGSAYRTDLKIEDLLNATYLPPSWKPVEPDL